MLIDVNSYEGSLKSLWADTFGDDIEYISLLFNHGYTPTECFAEIYDGKVVSCLYLLTGYIKAGGKLYEGRYLYAAATSFPHRGKGLMAKLIREAQQYIRNQNISFISLVPANDGLYEYYGKFGFDAIMTNFLSVYEGVSLNCNSVRQLSEVDFHSIRESLTEPFFSFGENEWKYALACLGYTDCKLIRNSKDSYYIISGDGSEVIEFVTSKENFKTNTELLLSRLDKGTVIVSPYDLSDYCECKEKRFGMIYFADEQMKNIISGSIYMNIALD